MYWFEAEVADVLVLSALRVLSVHYNLYVRSFVFVRVSMSVLRYAGVVRVEMGYGTLFTL